MTDEDGRELVLQDASGLVASASATPRPRSTASACSSKATSSATPTASASTPTSGCSTRRAPSRSPSDRQHRGRASRPAARFADRSRAAWSRSPIQWARSARRRWAAERASVPFHRATDRAFRTAASPESDARPAQPALRPHPRRPVPAAAGARRAQREAFATHRIRNRVSRDARGGSACVPGHRGAARARPVSSSSTPSARSSTAFASGLAARSDRPSATAWRRAPTPGRGL